MIICQPTGAITWYVPVELARSSMNSLLIFWLQGNDDQVFWAFAALTAAELKFPEPEGKDAPSWLSLAQAVFNDQAARWDTTTCGGGLRWQLYQYQAGYTIKNAISNGGFFQLAARLAYYTNNQTYADWAVKMWDWSTTTPLLNTTDWTIADIATTASNCSDSSPLRWTYNYGTYLMGAAYMYNYVSWISIDDQAELR